jgi:predicted homoserine dehydrogenase-like protein
MGKGLAYQSHITPGIDCVAMADIRLERTIACCELLRREYRVVHTLEEMHDTIHQSRIAVCEDGSLVARCPQVDVLIEASSSIAAGGQCALVALEHGKHVVMVNAEADLIFGPYLALLAEENRVVYTSCDGDQPAVIKRLVDELQFWGFELVMAGNIKGYLDRYSNPTRIIPEADKRNLDYKMAAGFTDGTKLCVEMALVANALGLSTTVPGMMGPKANHVREVFDQFDFEALWKGRVAVVDYLLGAEPNGGIFAVGYCDNQYQRSKLAILKMGTGPYYLFYRPYHLCHVEAMSSVVEAYVNRRASLQPTHGFRTNVYAYAKHDLRCGDKLDGPGGYACYGLIENCDLSEANPGLPICLSEGVTLIRDVSMDEKVHMDDVEYDRHRSDFILFAKALDQSRRMTELPGQADVPNPPTDVRPASASAARYR